jgi:hypothetical protein
LGNIKIAWEVALFGGLNMDYEDYADANDDVILACLKAIENGNCSSCDVCPIGKELFSRIPPEDRERAIKEHRFGVGADEVALFGGI